MNKEGRFSRSIRHPPSVPLACLRYVLSISRASPTYLGRTNRMSPLDAEPSSIVNKYFHDRKEEMEEMHDAFVVKPPHPRASSRASLQQPGDRRQDFMTALNKYSRDLDQLSREPEINFDVRNCEWSDVLKKLQDADDAVAKRMERDKTLWVKGRMVLTNMSNLFEPVLQAIPDELSFLHGGLALVLHVRDCPMSPASSWPDRSSSDGESAQLAKGREKIRGDIVNAFEDVTYTIAIAGNASEIGPADARLCDALDQLRITLFDAIPHLIKILVPEKLAKLAAPLRSSQAGRLLDSIRNDTRRVDMRARALSDQFTNEAAKITKEHVEDIHQGVIGLHEQFQGMDALQQNIVDMVYYALASQDGMAKMLSDAVESEYLTIRHT
ncbi:hypothetical protein B0T26DRAFT_137102 [Lasiosphaeria miniovina]|uniref:Uncharacterized protein n=1 Tax=Lasiosphaeria miniovina TaxID=1954250 RepID=A0AA40B4B1_9PEZI|nr:uncharacterized protein B0T26DRAFT_137102 [Lasiosphaeria miniovina]KAK0727450.1 hypothetical protein B0T26DRAFT_137102 [Lasiosphaeria miniovina]